MIDYEKGPKFYDRIFAKKSLKYFRRYDRLYGKAAKLLRNDDTVLEIGCGMGYFAGKYLAPRGKDFRAIDFSRGGISAAKKWYPKSAENFVLMDATQMPSMLFNYSAVCCLEMLEHTDSDVEILQRIKRGARVIASVPQNERMRGGKPAGWPAHRRSYDFGTIINRYGLVIDIGSVERIESWFLICGTR